jgi:hypothetical protein
MIRLVDYTTYRADSGALDFEQGLEDWAETRAART